MTYDLRNKAILTYLKIGSWSARKLDRKSTAKTTKAAGATADAVRVNKHLLASCDAKLRAITKHGGDMRRLLDAKTLPWDDAGNRLLPNAKAMEVIAELTQMKAKFEELVDDFVQDYPVLRAQALDNLGDLADPNDYPEPHVVRGKFSVSLTFAPMAGNFDSDMRIGLSDAQVDALSGHMEARFREQMANSMSALLERITDAVTHVADRMTPGDDGKAKAFHGTMVENLRELVNDVAALNVFDDGDIEAVRQRVARIAVFGAEQLRTDDTARDFVRREATQVAADIAAMWG